MWLLVFSSMISNSFYNPGKDKQSHLLKHALTRNHWDVDLGNMKIIDSSFHNNKFKRKTNYVKQGNLCVSPLSSLRKTKKEYYSNEKNEKNICNNWTFWKVVNPFQDGPFRDCSRMGEPKRPPPPPPNPFLPKICYKYPTKMELGTVIPYLKKTQKIDESRDILLEFCWN